MVDSYCCVFAKGAFKISLTNADAKELFQFTEIRFIEREIITEMAYDAVISLKHTIEFLLNSSHIALAPPSRKIIEFAYRQFPSLEVVLEKLDSWSCRKRVNALDGQIREAVCNLEDVLESHVSNQIVSQSESPGDGTHSLLFSIDLQDLEQDILSFTEKVSKIKEEYSNDLCNPLPEEEEDDDGVSSRIDSKKSKMVGLYNEFREMKHHLTALRELNTQVVSIVGMAGIGKTTIAKEIFEDPLISSHFGCRAWVTVGQKCQSLKEILRCILSQVNPDIDDKMFMEGDEEIYQKIYQYLKESLKDRRFLIVLDDVWDAEVWHDLIYYFPYQENGSRVVLTARLHKVARHASRAMFDEIKVMRFLDTEESWDLLCEKVFAEKLCPYELQKAGKKIAENCKGLPLTIVTVVDLLSKAEMTPEYWNKVAEKENSVFMDAYDEVSKVLYSSYEYLPQHLKAFFLYMGVFPENCEIFKSKLIKMWIAEGFLEQYRKRTSKATALKYLEELVSNSLVVVHQYRKIWLTSTTEGLKTCGLHSSFWHLCKREAGKNKFFYVLNSRKDGLEEGIKGQRRLCIHKGILLGIKEVHSSMENNCASTARSLLCYGPYHKYPVPICFGLRLLKVLDALTIHFYEFPMEVLKLVQLRYLSLTYNKELPVFISKLWKLQFLIVCRHLSIKTGEVPSYLPMEIWDMKELKHLQIMGSDLLDPCGLLLPNLLTLLDVSSHSCTKGVLENIPNLNKLGIQIELAPDTIEPLSCFDHISHLNKLESLKCVIVNPELWSEVVVPPVPLSIFPQSLRKLSLSGFRYPWEEMSKIASLPLLRVLKLRGYAFKGPKWEVAEKSFSILEFLLIEDTDLVQWKVGHGSFPRLGGLSIKHCYKLEELHWNFDNYLPNIELVDCNPLVVTSVKQVKEASSRKGFSVPDVYVHSSWDDGNLKS